MKFQQWFRRRYGLRGAYTWLVLLLSLGLVAAACGSDGSADDEADGEPAPGRTTLEAAVTIEPPSLVPHIDAHGGKQPMMESMLIRPLQFDNEDELFSYAFESWEVSEDGHTVTFNIQPDIAWSDGTPMTSADVVMSFTQYLDPGLTAWAGNLSGIEGAQAFIDGEADTVSGLSAPDEHTVVVELEEPNGAMWLLSLAQSYVAVILPEHLLGDVPHEELADHEYFETFPVTNGPYKFVDWVTEQYIELERNDDWSLGEPGFQRVFFKFISDDVQVPQLSSGEAQFVNVAPADVDHVSSFENVDIQSKVSPWLSQWLVRNYEPLQDPRVRQAMAYAIDREGICQEAFQGYCEVPADNVSFPSWATPDDLTQYNYDPERARQLLDEAGWDPDTELVFVNWTPPDSPTGTALTIAQGNMADVGINWKIESVDTGAYQGRLENEPESLHGTVGVGNPSILTPNLASENYSCESHYPDGANVSHYCNEELDELFRSGLAEADDDKRAEIYQDAARILNEDVPVVQLFRKANIVAFDSRIQGIKAHDSINSSYWNIGEWTWEE